MARKNLVPTYKKWLPGGRKTPDPRKEEWVNGFLTDVTPAPGNTFTSLTWFPRGRGRGESLSSSRRIASKLRAAEALRLRAEEHLTWQQIAIRLGYSNAGAAWKAVRRGLDRMELMEREQQRRKEEREL